MPRAEPSGRAADVQSARDARDALEVAASVAVCRRSPRTKAPTRAKKNGRWLECPKLPKEEDENVEPDVLSMLS